MADLSARVGRRGAGGDRPLAREPAAGIPVRELGPVGPVGPRAIAPHLPPDGAAMASEHAGDRSRDEAALAEQAQGVSFREGDLAVRHGRLLSLGGEQKTTVCQVTFLVGRPCCTYYMNARRLTRA